ncbi:MAG: hypothetical protein QXT05_00255, partial [Candidatus Bilamarchaeaceae archaeon]
MVTNSNFGKAGNGVIEKPAETKQSERGTTRMGGAAKQLPRTSSFPPLHEEIVSLDTVTGTIKRLDDKLQNIEKEVKALKDTTARLDQLKYQLKKEFKSRFGERVKEMEKDLQAFDKELTKLDEKIKDAEKDASDAETIAEGLRTIVVETHQPRLQQTEEELSRSPQEVAQVKNSFTPAPSPQAAEAVKDISVQPSAPVNSQAPEGESSAESGLSEDTEKIPTESEATSKTDSESCEVGAQSQTQDKASKETESELKSIEEILSTNNHQQSEVDSNGEDAKTQPIKS